MKPPLIFHNRAFYRLVRGILLLCIVFPGAGILAASAASETALQQALITYTVSSPDGAISATVTHDTTAGTLSYQVTRSGAAVIDSSTLGVNTSIADFGTGLAFVSRADSSINESYSLPGHKKATYVNQANQMLLTFSKSSQQVQLLVRAYNDGFAYRYTIPGSGSMNITSENNTFNLPDSASGWAQTYRADYQGEYTARSNFNSGTFCMPVLAQVGSNWVLMSESDVSGLYQGTRLNGGSGNNLKITWNDTSAISGSRPFSTPWRLAMIGSLNTLVRSTLVENLSTPSQIADTSWIVPGVSAWSWRAGGNQSDYNTHTQYVDFASSMGWEYYLVDAGWSASWVPTLVTYAQARNVKILLWDEVNNNNTEAKIRANFSLWAGWGVKGVKIDYFDYSGGDKQAYMQLYDTLARVAAEYHLLMNYHGATKPDGLDRKWPNILTREAVGGAELGSLSATHNLNLIFTRNVIGPMDYTPIVYSWNGSNTTWANQTAQAVTFASYIQHFSDSPTSYNNSVARDFLRVVPAVWDDTQLLEGLPGQYATLARRSGSDWYVGSVSGTGVSRTASIPLSFLSSGVSYTAHIYRDGSSNTQIIHDTQTVTSGTVLSIAIRAGGGVAIQLAPQSVPGGPPGYTWCADENGTCTFSGTASVAYGANGAFNYRTATSSIACNNTTFGDPLVGAVKACYYQLNATPPPTTPPPTTPPPSGNLALNKAATADSSCNANEGPAKAVNGSWSGGNSDKWCSAGATKWLRVDLGANYNITSFTIRHAGAGGESTTYNTKAFNIQLSTDGTNWGTAVVTVTGNTASVTTHTVTAATARYVRLNVTTPEQGTGTAARIYELEVYGSSGPTPTPTNTPVPSGSYEAETGALSGAAVLASCAACSGGQQVGFIGNGTANYVTLTVNASSAGNKTLTIYGCVSGTRSFSVSVNGGAAQTVSMTGSNFTNPFAASPITVSFNAGSNTIRFYNDGAYAPDLDRIVIQ